MRINAEHPISFAPYPGMVTKFIPPKDDKIRVDTALYSGYTIPPFYDSLIAKLICHEEDRKKAIEKMRDRFYHSESLVFLRQFPFTYLL